MQASVCLLPVTEEAVLAAAHSASDTSGWSAVPLPCAGGQGEVGGGTQFPGILLLGLVQRGGHSQGADVCTQISPYTQVQTSFLWLSGHDRVLRGHLAISGGAFWGPHNLGREKVVLAPGGGGQRC